MTVRVVHTRVDLQQDDQVVLAQGGVCPSHWNADHSLVGMDELIDNVRGLALIDMNNADYTMTFDEAVCAAKVILNGGSGRTLTSPTTADSYLPSAQSFITAFTASPIYYQLETDLDPVLLSAPNGDIVAASVGLTPFSFYDQNISDTAYSSAWNGDLMVATKNAVYDAIELAKNQPNLSSNFLLMGG